MNHSEFREVSTDMISIMSMPENLDDLTHFILSAQIVENLAKNVHEKSQVSMLVLQLDLLMVELYKWLFRIKPCSTLFPLIHVPPETIFLVEGGGGMESGYLSVYSLVSRP